MSDMHHIVADRLLKYAWLLSLTYVDSEVNVTASEMSLVYYICSRTSDNNIWKGLGISD